MGLDVVITPTPGLLDSIEQPLRPGPGEGKLVREYLQTPGVAGTDVGSGLLQVLGQDAEITEGSGWWRRIREWFEGETHTTVGTAEQRFKIAAYWLPLPNVRGAEAELSVGAERGNATSIEIKIAGIGGGSGQDVTVREGVKVKAKKHAQRVDVAMTGTFAKIEVSKDGQVIATYPRLISIDKRTVEWESVDDDGGDQPAAGAVAFSRGFDLAGSSATGTFSLGIDRGESWKAEGGLDISELQLTAKVARECKYEYDVGFEYTLPGGHTYRVTQYVDSPAYHWSVS